MPKIIAFVFMRQAFLISCSLACTETKQDWLLIFSTPWQLYFIKNESLLYKQRKTKAWDRFTLPLPSMKVFRISGRDGCFPCVLWRTAPASMKVFRISGRDVLLLLWGGAHGLWASMKVFRISGRDLAAYNAGEGNVDRPQWKSSA